MKQTKKPTTGHCKGEIMSVTLNHWLLAIPHTPSQDRDIYCLQINTRKLFMLALVFKQFKQQIPSFETQHFRGQFQGGFTIEPPTIKKPQ